MKSIRNLFLLISAMFLLVGCGKERHPKGGYAKLANLLPIEIESMSLVAEQEGNNKVLLKIPCFAYLAVDLDKVEYKHEATANRLTIELPQVSVISPRVDEENVRILDERSSFWAPSIRNSQLRERAEVKAQREMEDLALSSKDCLDMAKQQTERLIRCFYNQVNPELDVRLEWTAGRKDDDEKGE